MTGLVLLLAFGGLCAIAIAKARAIMQDPGAFWPRGEAERRRRRPESPLARSAWQWPEPQHPTRRHR